MYELDLIIGEISLEYYNFKNNKYEYFIEPVIIAGSIFIGNKGEGQLLLSYYNA